MQQAPSLGFFYFIIAIAILAPVIYTIYRIKKEKK